MTRGTWLALWVENAMLDLEVLSLRSMLGVAFTYEK